MLIEAILAYPEAIVGPDRATWEPWLAIVEVAGIACVLLSRFG